MIEGGDVYEGEVLMEALDPSIADGFRAVYEREVPIEVRHQPQPPQQHQQQQQQPPPPPQPPLSPTPTPTTSTSPRMFEAIQCKLLLQGPDDCPTALRMELSSEVDLFFSYVHTATEDSYRSTIHATQRLNNDVDFADYPKILVRMMNELVHEPHLHVGVLTLLGEQEARLDFIQNMAYKHVEIMSCVFARSPSTLVEEHITYRYNVMKARLGHTAQRLADLTALVKAKNPSLLLHLSKTPAAAAGSTAALTKR